MTNPTRFHTPDLITINRADLPQVIRSENDPNMYYVDGDNVCFTSEANARMWTMRDIAVWQLIKTEGENLGKRRAALAEQFGAPSGLFSDLYEPLRDAINHIIKLEDAHE